jgi:rhamnosyltransferase
MEPDLRAAGVFGLCDGEQGRHAVNIVVQMSASVVIRVRDEAARLERLLGVLAGREVIVVDSGSGDGSQDVARRHGAKLLEIDDFTFGRALNVGAAAAGGEVVIALSADALPSGASWVDEVAARFADPAVACVFGETRDWEGGALRAPVRQDAALARAHPFWGYSNGAGGFRAKLWRERPFREDLPGCEDREWALWALEQRGRVCLLDPALAVAHDHTHDGLRTSFRRYEREARGYAMFLDLPPYGAREALDEWWSEQGWHRSRLRARLDPRRVARLAGKWKGRR